MMNEGQVKFDKFYGELGIVRIDEIHGSTDKMLVFSEDMEKHLRVPLCVVGLCVTDKPSTSTDVRNKLMMEMTKETLEVLLKWSPKICDLDHFFLLLQNSIMEAQRQADDKLYGKSAKFDTTFSDLDRIIKS